MKKLFTLFLGAFLFLQTGLAQLNFIEENWDYGYPQGWTYTLFDRQSSGGVNNTAYIRANIDDTDTQANAITPAVNMGSNPVMTFEFRATNYSNGNGAAANTLQYNVAVSTNNGATWTNVYTVSTGQHSPVNANFNTKTVNVSAYANQTCMFRFTCIRQSGDIYVDIDDVWIGTMPVYDDLTAVSIEGNSMPLVNTAENYTVKVRNSSYTNTMTASDYTVKLMKVADPVDIELGSEPGVLIAPAETKDFVFSWTPTTDGMEKIYGEVILPTDNNPADNKTATKSILIMGGGDLMPVSIGDGTSLQRLPVDLYYRKSLSQSAYYPHEIGIYGGEIVAITYYANIATSNADLLNTSVKIWMGVADVVNLNNWVPYTNFTEVFSGNLSFPTGVYEVPIVLDVPFQYNGGTLVIYTQKFETLSGASTNNFSFTATENARSIRRIKDGGEDYDWQNPTEAGGGQQDIFNGFPNIKMTFDMDGMGILTGVVDSDTEGLLEGAKVQIENSDFYVLTDENGAYSFHLPSGSYNIEYSYLGHFNSIFPVTITANSTVTQNATLQKLPPITVSGTVTDYSSNPIENVEIILTGVQYCGPVYTDETGFYSIPNVIGNATYDITARSGYHQTYTNQIMVGTTNLTFDFQIHDYQRPPVNIETDGDIDDPNVVITWEAPDNYFQAWYILDDGTAESGYAGTSLNWSGNRYLVNETGQISSVDIYGVANSTADETYKATVQIYNAARTLVATSAQFLIPADAWINVPLNNVTYTNDFYVMVNFSLPLSNLLGYDMNGPNVGSVGYTASRVLTMTWSGPTDFVAMIRVNAKLAGKGKSVTYGTHKTDETHKANETRALLNYRVYRLPLGEEANEATWVELSDNVSSLTFTDNTFSSLPMGGYRWAVKAEYSDGLLSEAIISDPPLYAGLNAAVTVSITDTDDNPIEGASITLTNHNNDPLNVYTAKTNSEGIYIFPKVFKGTYDITVTKYGYENYADIDIEIDEDEITISGIELIDIIKTPFELSVEVDRCDALFQWSTFFTSTYILDDGTAEGLGAINPGYAGEYASIGNEFPIGETGYITSIELFGGDLSVANVPVYLDIYNEDRELVASSEPFYLPYLAWESVPFNNIPYSGKFYAMIRMPYISGSQSAGSIATDTNGPYSKLDLDWYLNGITGVWRLIHEAFPTIKCVYIIRASVIVTGELTKGKSVTYSYDEKGVADQVSNDGTTISSIVFDVPFDAESLYTEVQTSNSRMLEGYTIYLNDIEIVSNYPNNEFMFSGLPNGTYTAGVQSMFSTGPSAIIYSDPFEITCEHTVTFIVKDEDNNLINDAVIVLDGETLSSYTVIKTNGSYPYTVSKEGYENATGIVTVFDDDVTETVTLIHIPIYTVTYETPVNGSLLVTADGVTINSGDEVVAGTVLLITAIPDEGYNIGTLTVNGAAHTSGQPYTVTQDITIAATFNIKMFAVTYTSTGQGTLSVTKTATGAVIANNEQVEWNTGITVSATAEFGHYVSVFTINNSTVLPNLEVQHTVIAATAINCIFTEEGKFNLTLEVDPANSGVPSGAGDYYENEQVPVDVEVATNYEFVEWLDGAVQVSQTASFTYTMPAATKVLTAKMQGIIINISATVEPASGGEVTGASSDQIVYRYGDIAELTAIPNEADGYLFVYWKEGET
ncbi:MAG: carboxypeptidase regulatory-like domain-containing protein, partial [Lentimicrobiaceae bacterium]|nr:carboxypeptidase regulatory-like domain-containing protein [Lentimicrobiaceae bacterium]